MPGSRTHQAGVERVQQRAPDLAHLHGPEGWFDGPPDVPEVAFPGRQVPPGDLRVLLQQLRHGRIGFGRRPSEALLRSLPSSTCACFSVLAVALR